MVFIFLKELYFNDIFSVDFPQEKLLCNIPFNNKK